MSLINDALNRARADEAHADALRRGTIPPPGLVPQRRSRSAAAWLTAGVLGLALVAVLLWPRGFRPSLGSPQTTAPPSPGESAITPAPAEAPTEASREDIEAEPPPERAPLPTVDGSTPGPVPAKAAPGEVNRPSAPRVAAAKKGGQVSTRGSKSPPSAAPRGAAPAVTERSAEALRRADAMVSTEGGSGAEIPRFVAAYDLPSGGRVELSGIVWSRSSASAMLNGSLLGVGDEVSGLRILEIQPRWVVLGVNGRRVTVELPGSSK